MVRQPDTHYAKGPEGLAYQVVGDGPIGIAVHIAARIAAKASAREVLVSNTVKDLVYGSGITFSDRGAHALKGVPGEWRLFSPTGQHDPVEAALTAAQQF